MEAPIAVVTDVHHPSATRAVPIRDVELPVGEVGILGPVVGHRADLPWGLRSVDRADQPRGYTCRSRVPSPVKGHCFITVSQARRQNPLAHPAHPCTHTEIDRDWSNIIIPN